MRCELAHLSIADIFILNLLTDITLNSANVNGQTNKQLKRIVRRDGSPVVWSSDWSVDLRVEFVSRHPITMQFNCFFFKFDKTTEKVRISLNKCKCLRDKKCRTFYEFYQ